MIALWLLPAGFMALLPAPAAKKEAAFTCLMSGQAFGGEYEFAPAGATLHLHRDAKGKVLAFFSGRTLVDLAFQGREEDGVLNLRGDTHFWPFPVTLGLKPDIGGGLTGVLKSRHRDAKTPWKVSADCTPLDAPPERTKEAVFADCEEAFYETLAVLQRIHDHTGETPDAIAGILDHKLSHLHMKVWATQSCQDWTVRLSKKGELPVYYVSASPRGYPICRLVADAAREQIGPVGDCPEIKIPDPDPKPPEQHHGHGGPPPEGTPPQDAQDEEELEYMNRQSHHGP